MNLLWTSPVGPGAVVLACVLGGSSTSGCLSTELDPNYCANVNGDFFCAHRHGAEGPSYCVSASNECLAYAPDAGPDADPFDGCVSVRPSDDQCYSPCGGRKSILQDASCIEATDTEGTGGLTSTTSTTAVTTSGADGTTMGESTTSKSTTTLSTSSTTTDGSTTEMASSSTGSGDTGDQCRRWGTTSWGGCLTEYNVVDPCGPGTACILDLPAPVTYSACTTDCQDVCDCPAPPDSGSAAVSCGDIVGNGETECYLACNPGDCPDGMECTTGGFCAVPTQPAPMYGTCLADCEPTLVCATTSDGYEACVLPDCTADTDCDENPDLTSTATPTCGGAIFPPMGDECYLDCSGGANCPVGMTCVPPAFAGSPYQSICMW